MFNSERHASATAVPPSAATNRLGALRQVMVDESQLFQYEMEKKTVVLHEEASTLRQQLNALDQHVSYEAKQRVTADEDLARSLDKKVTAAGNALLAFVDQHCRKIEQQVLALEEGVDHTLLDTHRARSAQDKLLTDIRKDHHDAIADLHKDLGATNLNVVEFEGRFAAELSKSCGLLEDRMTLDLSIQQRISADLVNDVRAALSKRTKADEEYEGSIGILMLEAKEVHKSLADCTTKRNDAFAAFTETMDSMVQEVHEAVKKMNLSRGSELLMPRRSSAPRRTSADSARK